MKVLFINTHETIGGAALATKRLMESLCALDGAGVEASMLVLHKSSSVPEVIELRPKWRSRVAFVKERLRILSHLGWRLRKRLFMIDIASDGRAVTQHPAFKEADLIHLSWINQGMLSLKEIERIFRSGKPVVWTMHDIWPVTAICHLALECTQYQEGECRSCFYLPSGSRLAHKVWQRKQQLYRSCRCLHLVTCSQWLGSQAAASSLVGHLPISSIPNPIDTELFRPLDRQECRQALGLPLDKRLILFVAQRITNPHKGIDYLAQAVQILQQHDSSFVHNSAVVVLGGDGESTKPLFAPLPCFALGYVSDPEQLVQIYNAADIFALPSLSENLPNSIMEAMACGTPCIGFEVGGIPEEIDHRINGYVAKYKSAHDLARGVEWLLGDAPLSTLAQAARTKVIEQYSCESVAKRYLELYQSISSQD